MDKNLLKKVRETYNNQTWKDHFFRFFLALKEKMFGIDYSIFDVSIAYYKSKYKTNISHKTAYKKALDKKLYREQWYRKKRDSVKDILSFYNEVHFYPFRQPYIKRFQKYYWINEIIRAVHKNKRKVNILDYGCGSAVIIEKLIKLCPEYNYIVADIPSVTLDFVKWKKKIYKLKYKILEIRGGKIPLDKKKEKYDVIMCNDVLEHTSNPSEIVRAFISTLNKNGILLIDFLCAPGGENLNIAVKQREKVKKILRENLYPIKEIDKNRTNTGCYMKS